MVGKQKWQTGPVQKPSAGPLLSLGEGLWIILVKATLLLAVTNGISILTYILAALWSRWRWKSVVRRTPILGLFGCSSAAGEEERGQRLIQDNKKVILVFPSTISHMYTDFYYIFNFTSYLVEFLFFIFFPFVFLSVKPKTFPHWEHLSIEAMQKKVPQCALYNVAFSSSSGLNKLIYSPHCVLQPVITTMQVQLSSFLYCLPRESSLLCRNRRFIHSSFSKHVFFLEPVNDQFSPLPTPFHTHGASSRSNSVSSPHELSIICKPVDASDGRILLAIKNKGKYSQSLKCR